MIKRPKLVSPAAGLALRAPLAACRQWWSTLDESSQLLTFALALSLAFHAVVLSIRFQMPDVGRSLSAPMEVVIVNTKTRSKPSKADVLAQANVDGGGDVDQLARQRQRPVVIDAGLGDDEHRVIWPDVAVTDADASRHWRAISVRNDAAALRRR